MTFDYFKGIIVWNVTITSNNNIKCAIMYIYVNFIKGKKRKSRRDMKKDLQE